MTKTVMNENDMEINTFGSHMIYGGKEEEALIMVGRNSFLGFSDIYSVISVVSKIDFRKVGYSWIT